MEPKKLEEIKKNIPKQKKITSEPSRKKLEPMKNIPLEKPTTE
jgi:hypothetical protein